MALTDYTKTYCNPLPLPNYPRGIGCRNKTHDVTHFHFDPPTDFRETADPSAIFHEGKWYLYPSCGMVYVTDDFIRWKHIRMQPEDIGYAPTVVKHCGKFLLTACYASIYESCSPTGPFKSIGKLLMPDGKPVDQFADPMLFSDDDGRLFAYWGLGGDGIRGAEIDADNPVQLITKPKILFAYNPKHKWEHFGPSNEDPSRSYIEGSWMIKIGKKYFLTYAAPGTEWRTYGMGAYVSSAPLGPFKYQARNPILSKADGLIRGPGHGSIVKGPENTLWAFYTCLVGYEHDYERRVGIAPAGIDKNGNLFVATPSENPEWAPGFVRHPELGNSSGLLPLTYCKNFRASSSAPGRVPMYSADGSMLTWWQPADDDKNPSLTIDCGGYGGSAFTADSVRIIWKDVNLNYDAGILPGPFKFRVLTSVDRKNWDLVWDASGNDVDMLIDYHVFDRQVTMQYAKLEILGMPKGIRPGVIDFSVFGYGNNRKV